VVGRTGEVGFNWEQWKRLGWEMEIRAWAQKESITVSDFRGRHLRQKLQQGEANQGVGQVGGAVSGPAIRRLPMPQHGMPV
jgi:hypothetical protein